MSNWDKIVKEIFQRKDNFKGEFVVVVEGDNSTRSKDNNLAEYNKEINLMLSKFSLTDVVEIVHKLTGITKNKIYKCALELKRE